MDDGLIRVGGRIGLAHIPRDSKHQIILSPKHHISTLIVTHIHETNFHVGRNSTLAFTRENFWIISGKSFIRYTINRCNFCKRRRVQPMAPLMGELPFERIAYMEPQFSRTGVDYFGPLLIKRGKRTRSNCGTAERYGALFTYLTTRAVHVELAGDLSTDSFILALRRFISRRGHPKTIISDNGSNFVGAEREITKCLKDQEKICNELSKNEIVLKFNPTLSPWMGGAFEALVKSTKKALKTVYKDRSFTEEALQTFLAEVESTLNSRPLTSISDDMDDYQALTPNHFLLGRSSPILPVSNIEEKEINSRKRAVQAATEMYWKRWRQEYLFTLSRREKWNKVTRNFKPGDLVVVTDKNVIRSHWKLSRVIAVFPGKDDVVRIVGIKTVNGTCKRPSAPLVLLEEAN